MATLNGETGTFILYKSPKEYLKIKIGILFIREKDGSKYVFRYKNGKKNIFCAGIKDRI